MSQLLAAHLSRFGTRNTFRMYSTATTCPPTTRRTGLELVGLPMFWLFYTVILIPIQYLFVYSVPQWLIILYYIIFLGFDRIRWDTWMVGR